MQTLIYCPDCTQLATPASIDTSRGWGVAHLQCLACREKAAEDAHHALRHAVEEAALRRLVDDLQDDDMDHLADDIVRESIAEGYEGDYTWPGA